MSPTPRGKRHPGDAGIPEQRRADADQLEYITTAEPNQGHRTRFQREQRLDYEIPVADSGPDATARSPLRAALVLAAVLITLTAVLGALLGVNDSEPTPATTTTETSTNQDPPGAQLVGAGASTDRGETRWLTMRDDEPPASRSGESGIVVPEQGPGEFRIAAALDLPVPHGAFTYTVEVEENLDFTPDRVAGFVDATLTDSRSWGTDTRPLVRVNTVPSARVLLATPETADALCAPLETGGRLSCRNGANVVINAWRWVNGTPGYTKLRDYRRYVINHEVGHALGFAHQECPGPGTLAPVMLQQTLGLDGCRPNPWPEPRATSESRDR